ncbi:hypothetical protein RFI_14952 [Reticulomyxa filosa]|uniref:Acyl-CoA dehydrogenase/oxidase C-terminal domain-containing protein n=1 Tax=Reticulomyxa filosa TaxID=46433 RepID=X6N911_RETFI|nr:hypothetical protein RFI_14952 [Reticulomyxa filosa]|eukprot:ETO22249.1 hypothetical protein RFI_14952 [Reticulomyxa filosa]
MVCLCTVTGGMKADYFLTACQTIEEGSSDESKGKPKNAEPKITLLLIERQPGVITTRLPLQGHDCSATAYVVFRNVKVHKSMVVGKPKEGFKDTMKNFNQVFFFFFLSSVHYVMYVMERFGIICTAVGLAKVCVEEAVKYSQSRKTFGKDLVEHQAIRHKLAEMTARTMACHAYLENVAYRLKLNPLGYDASLVKDVALLKVNATRTLEFCAREASHIFGGRSYVKYGRAGKIERIYRDVRALAIYGGAEEIMLDLAVKQAKL